MKENKTYYLPCVVYMGGVYRIFTSGYIMYNPNVKDLITTNYEEAFKVYSRRVIYILLGRVRGLVKPSILETIAKDETEAARKLKKMARNM